MDDHIRKLDSKIRNKETEPNELFTKIQTLEKETLRHKKLASKQLETVEMSLTGVLGGIFEVDEEKDKN